MVGIVGASETRQSEKSRKLAPGMLVLGIGFFETTC